jgi:hypothetical protein
VKRDEAQLGTSIPSARRIFGAFGHLALPPVMVAGAMRAMFANTLRVVTLTISAAAADYNIYTQAGSPSDKVAVTLTINTGISVTSTDVPPTSAFAASSYWGLTTGTGWVDGSTIRIVNNGTIWGAGGAGGTGGDPTVNMDGTSGGHAILLSWPASIDNTNGYIYGGGGGGGGGNYYYQGLGRASGGGGGAGAGSSSGGVGAAGIYGSPGAGSAASGTSGGAGGAAGVDSFYGYVGGIGGAGGNAGDSGSNGGAEPQDGIGGGAGGYGGRAVYLNGYTVTWLGGNNGTQVRGAVA